MKGPFVTGGPQGPDGPVGPPSPAVRRGCLVLKGWGAMFDEKVSPVRTPGDRYYIRLRIDHPARHRSARLLSAVGGHEFLPAAGTVYEFATSRIRDDALQLVQQQMGWSVAAPFDG